MSHGIDFTGATAQPRDLGDDPAKLRDEIGRLTQRLVRARASYDSDIVRGSWDTPLEMQHTTIEGYAAKLDELNERLRRVEQPELPQRTAAEEPVPSTPSASLQQPVPAAPQPAPLAQRVPTSTVAPAHRAPDLQPAPPAWQPPAPPAPIPAQWAPTPSQSSQP